MKNKKCFLYLILFLIVVPGCGDILQNKPKDFLTPGNSYNNVQGIEQGITGLYADVRDKWYSNGGNQSYGLFGLGTDVSYDGETPAGQRFLTNYVTSVTPQNDQITDWWRYLYAEIQAANILIDGINNLDASLWENDAQKNAYLAEARFLRAFAHRLAVTLWGDVPLVTDVINGAKTDFVRTPKKEVYQQIEEDLIFATENLPEPGSEPAPGRLTQGAAWQLLTKVYLAEGKYQSAVESSSNVINNYNYALMTERFGAQDNVVGSGDVYSDLFDYGNQNASENTETIWAMQFEPNTEGGGNNYWSGIFGPRYFSWGKTPDGYPAFVTQYSDTLGRPVARNRGTNLVFYGVWQSDWDNDIRNSKTNIKRKFYFDSPNSQYDKHEIKTSLYSAGERNTSKDTLNYIFPFFLKTFSPVHQAQLNNSSQGGGGSVQTDFYVMRLAETYLLRAEAYVDLGNKTLAARDINVVRSRAHANPVSPADVDIDYILDERIRELYAEEMRLITLMRMNKLVERTRRYNDNPFRPGANIQDYNNLFPIPQSQIDLNNNADFKQNPGY